MTILKVQVFPVRVLGHVLLFAALAVLLCAPKSTEAQSAPSRVPATAPGGTTPAGPGVDTSPGITPPPGYVIGPEDVLGIVFWRERDISSDAVVRPDGMISLPLINDVAAAGLTPEELRVKVTGLAEKFVQDPTVSVIVKQIHSRKVFITGSVSKPGPYPLGGPLTVLQLIAMAGGVSEFGDDEHILILRNDNGNPRAIRFNYKEVVKDRKNLKQNIELKPDDTVVIP